MTRAVVERTVGVCGTDGGGDTAEVSTGLGLEGANGVDGRNIVTLVARGTVTGTGGDEVGVEALVGVCGSGRKV